MGKKKAATETKEEMLKSTDKVAEASAKVASSAAIKNVASGRIYIKATYNNTLISITDDTGNLLCWASSGGLGFAGPKKATPFAASKVVAALAEKLKKSNITNFAVYVNGIGGGRDSALRSFANQGFTLTSITDVTPIPHNGPRKPKTRRV